MFSKTVRNYSVPAGRIIRSFLSDNGIKHAEAADKLSVSPEDFEKIVNGEMELTKEIASRIENLYGLSSNLLIRIEEDHRNFIQPPPADPMIMECIMMSDKLEELLEKMNISRKELAHKSGMELSRIDEIIDDCEPYDYYQLTKLINLIGHKPDWMHINTLETFNLETFNNVVPVAA